MYIWGFFIGLMCSRARHGKLCDMGIGIIFLFCTLIGIVIAIGGFRSRAVACDPACANCGYDLRGYAVMNRCSECGSDLTADGAVRTTILRTSGKRIAGGLMVAAMPWLTIAVLTLLNFLGPNWERVRSSQSLIANIGQSGSDFWCWKELTRRLQSGQLTQPEATAAIDKLIAIVQPDSSDPMRWAFNFTWAANFFVAADRAKVISGPQYVAIAQACYGKTPRVEFRSSIPAESPSQLNIWPSNQGRALAGMHFTFAVQEISMRGANASTQDILNRPGQGTMLPPDINLLGKYAYLISAPQVPAGNYQIKFVIRTDITPGPGTNSWVISGFGPAPVAQWTETIIKPVKVYHEQYTQTPNRPFIIRTDADADPQRAGALSVSSAEAMCYTDVTLINFRLNVGKVPITCWFNAKISVNGLQLSGGNQLYRQD